MPAISTPKPDADAFLIMATEVHKLLTRPVGTEHARIRQLSKVLRDMANTNYDRGWNDALEAGGAAAPTENAPRPCVGSRVIISGATLELEGRIARVGAITGDLATVQMEDDVTIVGVNKSLLKVID